MIPECIRAASIPSGHAYVQNLCLDGAGIRVLDDPRPSGAPPGQWWPPAMVAPEWIAEHAGEFDVLHLHFGTESFTTEQLEGWLDALDRSRRPFVFTVHDLQHPQLADAGGYAAQLDLLVPRADALVTLTSAAQREIARRWRRPAAVIAHPRMVSEPVPTVPPRTGGELRVGIHLRDLRPNIDGPGTVNALADALAVLGDRGTPARGRVVMATAVRAEARDDAAEVERIVAAAPGIELLRRPPTSERALVTELLGLDVSLLPYRHGTHSGWAELCWDLGLAVVGSTIGCISDQHDDPGWFIPVDLSAPGMLADALAGVDPRHAQRPALIARRRAERDAQAPGLAWAHREIYRRAMVDMSALGPQAVRN